MMNKIWYKIFFSIFFSFIVVNLAYAKPLYIEITGGKNNGIPIAIEKFVKNGSVTNKNTVYFADTIVNDLRNSGQFNVSIASTSLHNHLKNKGIEKLITGKITINPDNPENYDIVFSLVDLYRKDFKVLLDLSFSNKPAASLRPLAHHISDLIFKKVIGVKGIFSTRIAYITTNSNSTEITHVLTIADSDGFNDRPLVVSKYPLMSPRWSPDGKKIVFVSFEDNRSSIKIVTLATGKIQTVSEFPGINGAPAWSPDGEKLALVLSKSGFPKIYLMDLNNKKEMKKLTYGTSVDTEPCFTPDGKDILFTSNRGGKAQIYKLIVATGEIDRITYNGDYNATPSLTPDGTKLIMLHKDNKGEFKVAVQDLKTGSLKILTQASLSESPTIAPNGMMVLYGYPIKDKKVLAAVTLDGKFNITLQVSDNGYVKEPAWSPM